MVVSVRDRLQGLFVSRSRHEPNRKPGYALGNLLGSYSKAAYLAKRESSLGGAFFYNFLFVHCDVGHSRPGASRSDSFDAFFRYYPRFLVIIPPLAGRTDREVSRDSFRKIATSVLHICVHCTGFWGALRCCLWSYWQTTGHPFACYCYF